MANLRVPARRCFEANVDKYVYEVCPFKSAAQKDGGMSTSLGLWKGFESNYKILSFQNGQQCWNGPSRSLRVSHSCNLKQALSVEIWAFGLTLDAAYITLKLKEMRNWLSPGGLVAL